MASRIDEPSSYRGRRSWSGMSSHRHPTETYSANAMTWRAGVFRNNRISSSSSRPSAESGSHLTSKRRAVSRSGPGSPSARATKSAISTDGRLGSDAKRDFRRMRRVANFRGEVPTSRHVYRLQGFGPTRSANCRSQIGRTIRNECRSLPACNRQQRRHRKPP
jgi:hypothetical protein